MDRDDVIHELIDIQYDRNDYELKRGTFRVRGRHRWTCSRPTRTTRCASSSGATRSSSISEIDNVTGRGAAQLTRRCPSGPPPIT